MDKKHLSKIFLSASIPTLDRDPSFFESVDIIAVRDAVRALASVIIPYAHLVWGGHPSITPLIRNVMGKMSADIKSHVTIYQSSFFEGRFPPDNFDFENIELTKAVPGDRDGSLHVMRQAMLSDNTYVAAVFIGGMEGIYQEYEMLRSISPTTLFLPVASTGAAARVLYERNPENFDPRLANDYAYMALFRDLLSGVL